MGYSARSDALETGQLPFDGLDHALGGFNSRFCLAITWGIAMKNSQRLQTPEILPHQKGLLGVSDAPINSDVCRRQTRSSLAGWGVITRCPLNANPPLMACSLVSNVLFSLDYLFWTCQ